MKNILLFTLLLLSTFPLSAQKWQWQWYFYVKLGAKHNFSTYQDASGNTERTLKTPEGFYNLVATTPSDVEINPNSNLKFETFSFAFPVGFYAVSPVFLATGIEYQPITFRSAYKTNAVDNNGYFYVMDELNTLHSVSFPLFVDSRPLYHKLSGYAGIRFHVNIENWQLQKISWNDPPKLRKVSQSSNEFSKTSISYACGINYSFLSLEFSLLPTSFFNKDFTDEYGKKTYSHLADYSIKSITASIMIGKLKKNKKPVDDK